MPYMGGGKKAHSHFSVQRIAIDEGTIWRFSHMDWKQQKSPKTVSPVTQVAV